MKSNKGFSLIELIVVIAIMAVIAAVAIPVYSGYIETANAGVAESQVAELAHSLQLDAIVENPAKTVETVEYAVGEDGTVTVTLKDADGNEIKSGSTSSAVKEAVKVPAGYTVNESGKVVKE